MGNVNQQRANPSWGTGELKKGSPKETVEAAEAPAPVMYLKGAEPKAVSDKGYVRRSDGNSAWESTAANGSTTPQHGGKDTIGEAGSDEEATWSSDYSASRRHLQVRRQKDIADQLRQG